MNLFKFQNILIVLTLSILGSVSTYAQPEVNNGFECYELIESNTGMIDLYSNSLDEASCNLISKISEQATNRSSSINFNVLGCDFYPVLAYKPGEDSFIGKYEEAVALMDDDPNRESFIMITKEHHKDQNLVTNYRVHIKWPTIIVFDTLNPLEKSAIINNLEKIGNDVGANAGNSSELEIQILKKFTDIILYGYDRETVFEDAGFDKVDVTGLQEIVRFGESNPIIEGNVLINDFSGYGISTPSPLLLADALASLASDRSGVESNTSYLIIITGKENIDDQNNFVNNSFYQASDSFEDGGQEIKIWMHFDFYTPKILGLDNEETLGSRSNSTEKFLFTKIESNVTLDKAENYLNQDFEKKWDESTKLTLDENGEGVMPSASCSPSWKFGRNCIYHNVKDETSGFDFFGSDYVGAYLSADAAYISGILDGFLGTINFLWDTSSFLLEIAKKPDNWVEYVLICVDPIGGICRKIFASSLGYSSSVSMFKSVFSNPEKEFENARKKMSEIGTTINTVWTEFDGKEFACQIWQSIESYVGSNFADSYLDAAAYGLGVLTWEIILDAITVGGAVALQAGQRGAKLVKAVGTKLKSTFSDVAMLPGRMADNIGVRVSKTKMGICKLLRDGCFVKDTPVLMASNSNQFSFKNTGRALAVAATMPIVAVPIQEVQLLDYAVAHETVNATYGLTASTDDDIYLGLMDKDPYTSDQQRERDEYEINDTDWNEVVFEEVNGSSTARLALHDDWINQKGYLVNGVVNLDLPEQGISGLFRITSIKHIIPQKKPVDDDEADDYGYKPVTALFTHESNQVYNIGFDNGEELGVTYQHPIYSTTAGDWKLAGELEVGEKVLTKEGEATVIKSTKKVGSETVYNLEVKELHNFLVGESRVVVHNGCIDELYKFLVSKVLLKGSKIPKRLTVKSGGDNVFVSASGLKHTHEKMFKAGFDAELDKFTFKIPIAEAENLFSIKMMDMSANIDLVLAGVKQNAKWGEKVYSNGWEFIFKAPSPGQDIKLYHALFQ